MMKKEIKFILKVIRNSFILGGLYFFSVWAANSALSFETFKPILIFIGTYILAELAKRYGLEYNKAPEMKNLNTIIF